MIVEIALGIVLAYIIIRLLPLIIGLGLIALLVILALAAVAAAFWLFASYPTEVLVVGGLLGAFIALHAGTVFLERTTQIRPRSCGP